MKEGEKVIVGINKNVSKIKWECIIKNCKASAINSHIYQQNGILNSIAEQGHVMEVKPIDVYKWQDKKFSEITTFKKIGVNQAHSYPTLCNHHDTTIFADIEKHPVELEKYHNQLLFFYRTLLSSKRKEQIVLEKEQRIVNSKILNSNPSHRHIINNSKKNIEIIKKLIDMRDIEIEVMESDLRKSEMSYEILKLEYPLIKAYTIILP